MEKMKIINEKTKDEMALITDNFDYGFGIGDYYYNGLCSGSQVGFCWEEELGQDYVDFIFFVVYVGDEKENDLYTCRKTLKNLTTNEKLTITLSDEDFKKFIEWFNTTLDTEFHYFTDDEIKELEK